LDDRAAEMASDNFVPTLPSSFWISSTGADTVHGIWNDLEKMAAVTLTGPR